MSVIDYRPPPVVGKFLQSEAFIRAVMGPYGSGKSVGCVMALLKWAMEYPKAQDGVRYTRFVIVRNTNRMLEDTTIQTVHEWVPPGAAGHWLSTKKNFTLQFGDVHSEWWFRALDTPDDARNLLSLEVTGGWLNEYREIHPQILMDLIGRCGRFRGPSPLPPGTPARTGIIMDSNPPSIGSYWYELFEKPLTDEMQDLAGKIEAQSGRPLRELFKQPSGLSPEAENIEHLPPNYYELMVANNADKGSEWVKVHVHGQYGYLTDGEPVYHGFNEDVHVSKKPLVADPRRPLLLGMDFGLTPAVVVCQHNARGQWLVLGEMAEENMGLERFVEQMLPWLRERWPDHPPDQYVLWADPAGTHRAQTDENTCFKVLRTAGFVPRKGPQDLTTRVGSVQRVLSRMIDGHPGIIYDPSCRGLINGKHGEYHRRRKQTRTGELVWEPVKNEASHIADAEQYVIGAYEGPGMKGGRPRDPQRGHSRPVVVRSKWSVYA